jgi:L-ascorbate metabolism protein UlaG (beta-lactamase superfamily)
VSRYLNAEGINKQRITEMDWWQGVDIAPNIQLAATPARHFSGRGLKRNGSLWASFVLVIDGYKIFIGSDSGYDTHFREIGKQYGPFDIALLECGQYNQAWPFIHSMPEELVTEGNDLNAKVLMPVHWGKFALALHPWDEPVKRFVDAAEKAGIDYTIPMIGQPVVLDEYYPKEKWWTDDITT